MRNEHLRDALLTVLQAKNVELKIAGIKLTKARNEFQVEQSPANYTNYTTVAAAVDAFLLCLDLL